MKKIFVILLVAVLLVGCGSLKSEIKNSTMKETYETIYKAIIEKDMDTLNEVIVGEITENTIPSVLITNMHNVFVKPIYEEGEFILTYARANVDVDTVKDMLVFEFVCFMKTDQGYEIVLNMDEFSNYDEKFSSFMEQAKVEIDAYMETEQYQNDYDLQQQFIQENQELLNQAMQNAQNAANQAQNAANQAMQDAQNAANQAMNQNIAPVAPMPMP